MNKKLLAEKIFAFQKNKQNISEGGELLQHAQDALTTAGSVASFAKNPWMKAAGWGLYGAAGALNWYRQQQDARALLPTRVGDLDTQFKVLAAAAAGSLAGTTLKWNKLLKTRGPGRAAARQEFSRLPDFAKKMALMANKTKMHFTQNPLLYVFGGQFVNQSLSTETPGSEHGVKPLTMAVLSGAAGALPGGLGNLVPILSTQYARELADKGIKLTNLNTGSNIPLIPGLSATLGAKDLYGRQRITDIARQTDTLAMAAAVNPMPTSGIQPGPVYSK